MMGSTRDAFRAGMTQAIGATITRLISWGQILNLALGQNQGLTPVISG